jgi:hypothetical protein
MLRIFEKDVMPLIGGRAKAMIVTTSRVAGLRHFQIIKEKLKERGAACKALSRLKKVSVQDTIAEIQARFDISDEEALYIKQRHQHHCAAQGGG